MGSQIEIDYENIPAQSKNIRGLAREINNKLLNVYGKIAEMHVCWYGKRYNELVTNFNELVPQFNQFVDVIVGEVPYMFEKFANSISDVDVKYNVAVPQRESVQKIQLLPVIDDVGMRYISAEVDEINTNVVKLLQDAEDTMEGIKRIVEQINIDCDGSAEFKNQFSRLSDAFQYTINNVEKQFSELMKQDKELIETAEKKNQGK